MEKNIYIVGAHSRGETFYVYVTALYKDTCVHAFLVDDLTENPSELRGVKVLPICEESGLNPDYPVYLATRGEYHEQLQERLRSLGMKYIYPVDVTLDIELRNAYVRKIYEENGREFRCIDECDPITGGEKESNMRPDVRIYVASLAQDRKLSESYELTPDEGVIQVGAALTEDRIPHAAAYDNEGIHISERNRQFCELTALYWIWKNAGQDIVGLAHYRRHFTLPEDWIERFCDHEIDVILPVPLYVGPSIAENYKNRHDKEDWEFVMDYLREHHSEDYERASEFFRTSLFCPCNMFIMRQEVLECLCEWMFPVIEALYKRTGQKKDHYQNRYPGFISERLITYFFLSGKNDYKVAFANKNFLK